MTSENLSTDKEEVVQEMGDFLVWVGIVISKALKMREQCAFKILH